MQIVICDCLGSRCGRNERNDSLCKSIFLETKANIASLTQKKHRCNIKDSVSLFGNMLQLQQLNHQQQPSQNRRLKYHQQQRHKQHQLPQQQQLHQQQQLQHQQQLHQQRQLHQQQQLYQNQQLHEQQQLHQLRDQQQPLVRLLFRCRSIKLTTFLRM